MIRPVDGGAGSAAGIDQRFDCYAASPYDGLLFATAPLSCGRYVAIVQTLGETGLWVEKSGRKRGGVDTYVTIHRAALLSD